MRTSATAGAGESSNDRNAIAVRELVAEPVGGHSAIVHRDLDITVPSEATDQLIAELEGPAGVISISVNRGISVKPPGDVISAAVLNDEVDAVLSLVEHAEQHGSISVSTSSLDSLTDSDNQNVVRSMSMRPPGRRPRPRCDAIPG